eukprot:s8995_g4.t1
MSMLGDTIHALETSAVLLQDMLTRRTVFPGAQKMLFEGVLQTAWSGCLTTKLWLLEGGGPGDPAQPAAVSWEVGADTATARPDIAGGGVRRRGGTWRIPSHCLKGKRLLLSGMPPAKQMLISKVQNLGMGVCRSDQAVPAALLLHIDRIID